MIWHVLESKRSVKQLSRCPNRIKKEYEVWKTVVEFSGPSALRKMPGYRDHALKGDWEGARSSSLNLQWRVIYHVDKQRVVVNVLEVNPHDYG